MSHNPCRSILPARHNCRASRKRLVQAIGASLLIHAPILFIPVNDPVVKQQSKPFPALSLQFAAIDSAPPATAGFEQTEPPRIEPQATDPDPIQPPAPESGEPPPTNDPVAADTAIDDSPAPATDQRELSNDGDPIGTPAPVLPVREHIDPLDEYQLELYQRIRDARSYPRSAMARRQDGAVGVQFTVSRDGALLGAPVVESPSRYSALNRAAVQAVRDAAPFPPFPDTLPRLDLEIRVTIRFSLS